jgi:hypothetical protein
MEPSPAPWHYAEYIYGLRHCLIDRDGRVIGCNLPIGNGPLGANDAALERLRRRTRAGRHADQAQGSQNDRPADFSPSALDAPMSSPTAPATTFPGQMDVAGPLNNC